MDKIEAAFWEFHHEHPEVYAELIELSETLYQRGIRLYGIKALFEVIRYHRYVKTTAPVDEFKLNNNHAPLYSRLIMQNVSKFDGFFKVRKRYARGIQRHDPDIDWRDDPVTEPW